MTKECKNNKVNIRFWAHGARKTFILLWFLLNCGTYRHVFLLEISSKRAKSIMLKGAIKAINYNTPVHVNDNHNDKFDTSNSYSHKKPIDIYN